MARTKIKVAGTPDTILDQTIGTVGSVANEQGPLVDGDFPTPANVAAFALNTDASKTAGGATASLTPNSSPSFTEIGFFGREEIVVLDGTNNLTSTDAHYQIGGGGGPFSTGLWVYKEDWSASTSGTVSYPISSWAASNRSFIFETQTSTGRLSLFISTTGANASDIGYIDLSTIGSGWHHLVVTSDGTDVVGYFDGQAFVKTAITPFTMTSGYIELGGLNGPDFPGKLQDFFFAKGEAYTDAQINAIYSKRFTNAPQIQAGHVLTDDSFPYSDLTDKVSYWNLNSTTTTSDGSPNGKPLTNVGGVTFAGIDIFGQSTIAEFAGSDRLTSVDPIFNQGGDFTISKFVSMETWTPSSVQALFTIASNGSDVSAQMDIQINGDIRILATNTEAIFDAVGSYPNPQFVPGSTHHITYRFTTNKGVDLFLDGVLAFSLPLDNRRSTTSPLLTVGATATGGSPLVGTIEELSFAFVALSDNDILKLYSSRTDLNNPLTPSAQTWTSDVTTESTNQSTQIDSFIVDKTDSSLYFNVDKGIDDDNFGWTAFTPTGAWTTNTTYSGLNKRVGGQLHMKVEVTTGGAPDAVPLTINMPPGLTIDTSKLMEASANREEIGTWISLDSGSNYYHGTIFYSDTTTVNTNVWQADNTFLRGTSSISNTLPFTFAAGDQIWITISVPILEWQDNQRNPGDTISMKLERNK